MENRSTRMTLHKSAPFFLINGLTIGNNFKHRNSYIYSKTIQIK